MSYIRISLVVLFFSSLKLFGQSDSFNYEQLKSNLLQDKKLILKADSLNQLKQNGLLSVEVLKIIEALDKQHPMAYFQKSASYLDQLKLNEASFLYYTGYLRYKYYNAANPTYQIGNDGALIASLMATLQDPLIRYLRSNIDNYIEILKKSSDWHLNHDYVFFSREKSPEKYVEQATKMKSIILELETNKSKRKAEWDLEQQKYKNNLDSLLAKVSEYPVKKVKRSKTQDIGIEEDESAYINSDSLMFCGQKIKSPKDCQMVMPGLITCDKYGMVWRYESIAAIKRHKKEGITGQTNQEKFNCYILGTKQHAYKSKFETGFEINFYGVIKGKGMILSIYILDIDKVLSNDDIPEFIRQVFTVSIN